MLKNNYNEKILGFQGVKIKNIENSENKLHIELELERKIHNCPVCGEATSKIHDYRKQKVKDIPAFVKKVLLVIRKRRYVCNRGKRLFEKNDFLARYQRITKRLKHNLYDCFKRYSKEERAKVRCFVSDMYKIYEDIAKVWFPNAVYIIDKYHLVRQMNYAFERVRKDIQKMFSKDHRIYFKHSRNLLLKRRKELTEEQKQQVNIMLYTSADLSSAYHLKEEMYRMLDETPPEQFNNDLKEWIRIADNSDIEPFVKCAQTYRHWF